MKVALVGYGKMGRVVEELAASRAVEVVDRFTRERPLRADEATRRALSDVVLVDFSVPDAVADTVRAAAELSLPIVIGTTGWQDRRGEVRKLAEGSGIGVVQGANFSLGVNVFYRLVEQAAKILSALDTYDPFIQDWHHRFKKDSPSGTALEIQRRMARYYGEREVPITCRRAGYVPSEHAVGFDSAADTIYLEHRARNRQGLAEGALLAAKWIAGRSGFHDFRRGAGRSAAHGARAMTFPWILFGALLPMLPMMTPSPPSRPVPFDSGRWRWSAAESRMEDYLGRKSLYLRKGIATVADARFVNGWIEFDMAFTGERGFMGAIWRVQDTKDYEEFYLRPHQSGNPDATQYTPVFHGSRAGSSTTASAMPFPRPSFDAWTPSRSSFRAAGGCLPRVMERRRSSSTGSSVASRRAAW